MSLAASPSLPHRLAGARKFVLVAAVAVVAIGVHGCSAASRSASHQKRGDEFASSGKWQEAAVEYRNAVEKDPRSGLAHLGLAKALLRLGNQSAALAEMVRAADLLPNDDAVQVEAAQGLLAARRNEDARARADRVLSRTPSSFDATMVRLNANIGLGQLDAALRDAEQAFALGPDKHVQVLPLIGLIQLTRGDLAEAEGTFVRAVKLDDKAVGPRVALANYYAVTGRLNDAESMFQQALALGPTREDTNRAVVTFYQQTGRPDRAVPYLETLAREARDPAAWLDLAERYASLGRTDDAVAAYGRVTSPEPARALAEVRSAELLHRRGDRQVASQRLDAVLRQAPLFPPALTEKGRELIVEGRPDEAEAVITKAISADPQLAAPHYYLGVVLLRRGNVDRATREFYEALRLDARSVDALQQLAGICLRRGDTSCALEHARQAFRLDRANTSTRMLLADALLAAGQGTQAETEIQGLARNVGDSAGLHSRLGAARLLQKDTVGARREYERALALSPGDVDALSGLTRLDMEAGAVAAARQRLEKAVGQARSPQPALLKLLARVQLSAKDPASAGATLRRAVAAAPADLEACSLLSNVYFTTGNVPAARRELERAIESDPRQVGALTMLGIVLEAQGDKEGAAKRYAAALDVDPRAGVAANNLAWLTAERGGSLDLALQWAQSAKAAMPDRPEVDDTLAYVYLKKNLGPLAVTAARESIAKDPGNPSYHFRLGMAYAQTGDRPRAAESLRKALELKADFPEAPEARKQLAALS